MSRFNVSAWAVAHPALILFLIVMLGTAGLFSYRSLGRGEDPSFTIKLVVVTAMWPGATAGEMQTQVADPIEKKMQELPFIDKVTTYSKSGFTAMQVAFKDNTPARDVPQLFYQLRKKLSDIKDDLPSGLIGPSVNDGWGDVDSILYMLTADGADYAQMKKVAGSTASRPSPRRRWRPTAAGTGSATSQRSPMVLPIRRTSRSAKKASRRSASAS